MSSNSNKIKKKKIKKKDQTYQYHKFFLDFEMKNQFEIVFFVFAFYFFCVNGIEQFNNEQNYPGKLIKTEFLGWETFSSSSSSAYKSRTEVNIYRLQYLTIIKNQYNVAQTLVFSLRLNNLLWPASIQKLPPFLVVYAHPTYGANCHCSFSHNGTNQNKMNSIPFLQSYIEAGLTIIVPDYYGFICAYHQFHPYLIGVPAAHSILDAIRVVKNDFSNYYFSKYISGYGWSQGGHVILWTQQEAPNYAPELELLIIGAIAPPTFLPLLIPLTLNSLAGKYLTILGMFSWPLYYPELNIDQLIYPIRKNAVNRVSQVCVLDPNPEKNLELLPLLFLGPRWLKQLPTQNPLWNKRLMENSPSPHLSSPITTTATPTLFIFQGKNDPLINWNVTTYWVEQALQSQSYNNNNNNNNKLHFYLDSKANHSSIKEIAMPILFEAIMNRFLSIQL